MDCRHTLTRRTNGIGIRKAPGATRANLTRLVIGDALGMVCAGIALGAPVAFWAKRFTDSLIGGTPTESIVTIVLGAATMLAVALLSAFVPARRAATVDPMEALRHE
jgi:ABC-type antimicrobial peptide transport system permease subunit